MNDIRTPATPFQKCESGNFILRTFLKMFAPYVTCYKTVIIRRPDRSVYHVRTVWYQLSIRKQKFEHDRLFFLNGGKDDALVCGQSGPPGGPLCVQGAHFAYTTHIWDT